ncbi:hypothetical protein DFH09DRAFT_1086368 [Mycena vulgaris]|nr:hypothetical protein DFH09DRAFT_1086368 [Mycena vulgaris]
MDESSRMLSVSVLYPAGARWLSLCGRSARIQASLRAYPGGFPWVEPVSCKVQTMCVKSRGIEFVRILVALELYEIPREEVAGGAVGVVRGGFPREGAQRNFSSLTKPLLHLPSRILTCRCCRVVPGTIPTQTAMALARSISSLLAGLLAICIFKLSTDRIICAVLIGNTCQHCELPVKAQLFHASFLGGSALATALFKAVALFKGGIRHEGNALDVPHLSRAGTSSPAYQLAYSIFPKLTHSIFFRSAAHPPLDSNLETARRTSVVNPAAVIASGGDSHFRRCTCPAKIYGIDSACVHVQSHQVVSAANTCLTLDASWAYEIGSIGPDAGATSYGYSNTDCTGTDWSFTYPGDATGGWATSSHWENKAVLMTKTRAGTYYYLGGGTGACGTTLQNSEMIVALSFAGYASGANCGRDIIVCYGSNSVRVTVKDACTGCVGDSIDLSFRWKDPSYLVLGLGSIKVYKFESGNVYWLYTVFGFSVCGDLVLDIKHPRATREAIIRHEIAMGCYLPVAVHAICHKISETRYTSS